jgi:P-type Ca2+ transporter type 2C
MRSIQSVASIFPKALETGLTTAEAAESRNTIGANVLTPAARTPAWKLFVEKFDDPIIRILLAASILSMSVDLFKAESDVRVPLALSAVGIAPIMLAALVRRSWLPATFLTGAIILLAGGFSTGHTLYEGMAVMVAVLLATGVSFFSEYKSNREFEILNANKDSLMVKVMRDGATITIPMEEVVVGDMVILDTGDQIPADGRVVAATELKVDQSLMNGEPEPAAKYHQADEKEDAGPDRPGCVYRGTYVVQGVGKMLVTDVGDESEFGRIAKQLSGGGEGGEARIQTPLQVKLERLAKLISRAGYAAALLIFLILLTRGVMQGEIRLPAPGEEWGTVLLSNTSALLQYIIYMVIVVVVAVPEGLPMSVMVSLALAMRKMTRSNCLVRQLAACETMGSITIICTDKTGTLTENRMTVEEISDADRTYEAAELSLEALDAGPKNASPSAWVALASAVSSTAHLEERNGKTTIIGDTTEGALLQWLRGRQVSYEDLRLRYPALVLFPFSSEDKRMSVIIEMEGRLVMLSKGAPEILLSLCGGFAEDKGVKTWEKNQLDTTHALLHRASEKAMRTLAFAYAVLPTDAPRSADELRARKQEWESMLVYAGFAAIRDPLRPEVPEAMEECRSAGIRVQMITGDSIVTARAIAREIGLLRKDSDIGLTSEELQRMSDDEVKAVMPDLRVIARAQPLDKLRIVRLHQEMGEVVAVTGDGTNDAPALKQADVGLAMGKAGTEVAKEASKMIILDDSFGTIVKGVYWGRALYENIQRFLQFQLTINVSALGISFFSMLLGIPPPFTVLQFLWINVIMDTLAAIALCSEKPRRDLILMPPKRKDEPILTRSMITTILSTATFYAAVILGLLFVMQGTPEAPGWLAGTTWLTDEQGALTGLTTRQATIIFSAYVLFQVWNLFNNRSVRIERSGLRAPFSNVPLLAVAVLIVLGQLIIVGVGGSIFQVEPLSGDLWLKIGLATGSVVIFHELARRIRLMLHA